PRCALRSSFLCGYGAPRDLHSFPTRRSSDLEARRLVADDLQELLLPRIAKVGALQEFGEHANRGEWRLELMRHLADEVRLLSRQDRKSTRLNSSHVKISYAVFCLKKKTKTYY